MRELQKITGRGAAMPLTEEVKREAYRLGFQAVGISRVESIPSDRARQSNGSPDPSRPSASLPQRLYGYLQEWLHRGNHGTMSWMARDPRRRSDPGKVLAGCRSVISVGMNYYSDHRADERPGHGRIARYAWGEDYHRVLGRRLEQLEAKIRALAPDAQTRSYVDTGPVMEKAWAQQAGIGWIGKHSNLVSPKFGSWLLLGEILTTLELDPDEPGTDLCGSCTLCIRACPTGAITEPYVVDARKCISYLTIELRGPGREIPTDLQRAMGNRIFGCDDCLEACPYNANASPTAEPAFQPSPLMLAPKLAQMATMSEEEFAVTFRHSALKRPKHAGFLRNVQIALQNLKQFASAS